MKKLFCALLFLALPAAGFAATRYATSPSYTDVNNAVNGGGPFSGPCDPAVNGCDTVVVPAGTAHWSGTSASLGITKGITLQGQTTVNTSTPAATVNDQTIIIDDGTTSAATIYITLTPNQTFRMTGFTFRRGTNLTGGNNPGVSIGGTAPGASGTGSFRIDHCHFDNLYRNQEILTNGWLYGVMDHNLFYGLMHLTLRHGKWGGTTDEYGDGSWSDAPYLSSNKFIFVENNCFVNAVTNGSNGIDGKHGARFVVRHNFFTNNLSSGHGTECGRERGVRLQIFHDNVTNYTFNFPSALSLRGETGLVYNNTITGLCHALGGLASYRLSQNCGPWNASSGANPWDLNDTEGNGTNVPGHSPHLYESGTHQGATSSVVNDPTKNWTPNYWMHTSGVAYQVRNERTGYASGISANTATTLTTFLQQPSQTVSFVAGDQYTIHRVLISMDQAALGQGDLLSGANPTPRWLNQVREPTYSWNNTVQNPNVSTGNKIGGNTGIHIANRDFFNDLSATAQSSAPAQTSPTSPFNGTVGVGYGTLANRPTTCTPKVAYWATDQNKLYQCSATNTWSVYYTPYTYPHPLVSGEVPPPSDTTPPTVSITAPANNATVSGNVTVSATASDTGGVAGIQFKADDSNIGGEDLTAPYSVTWDSTTVVNGTHTITATAYDTSGNPAPASITVTVDNGAPPAPPTNFRLDARAVLMRR